MDRKDPAIFRSIRNVFSFGRGGTTNLKCIYKFEGQRAERVRLRFTQVMTMNRNCYSKVEEDINRSFCYGNTNVRVEVRIHLSGWMVRSNNFYYIVTHF